MDSRQSFRFDEERGKRRVAVLVVVASLLLAIGVLIGRGLTPTEPEPPVAETETGNQRGDGLERTQGGAVEAATNFARIMTGPSGNHDAYRAAMLEIAAPDWAHRAEELASNAIAFVNEQYGEGGRVSFHPIRYRIVQFSDEEATIDIWGLVLASGPELKGLEESWITGTLELVWIDEQWKVNGQSSRGGPTPELLRTDGEAAVPEELEGLEEYEDARP